MAVVEGTDVLIMHLCENTTPEDQKFILQEVGDPSHAFLLWLAIPWTAQGVVEVK